MMITMSIKANNKKQTKKTKDPPEFRTNLLYVI